MKEIAATARYRAAQPELPGVSPLDRSHGRSSLSPKRPSEDTSGLADVFPYYAGFSYDWARALLASQALPETAVILDPWNGSGTTTLAAQHEGFRSIGIDRNPVANMVARLRANSCDAASVRVSPTDVPAANGEASGDPLAAWFCPKSSGRIRDWAQHLASLDPGTSTLAYVALFRTIRSLTRSFEGSNPTWVKRAKSDEDLISLESSEIDSRVLREQDFLTSRVLENQNPSNVPVQLSTALSSALPVASESVDVVLTSPPYLTRIDYAVAYTRELAVLGIDISRDRTLRSALMGTTLIRKAEAADLKLGPVATSMLEAISSHSSKASSGYYRKQAIQYLNDLGQGLNEITRVTRNGGFLHLVVQDSYYKDVPVRLADICVEESELRGWRLLRKDPYLVKRTLTSLNKAARNYKKADVSETVVTLRKN